MAIEKNPFDKIEETISNVVQLPEKIKEATDSPSFEVDPDGGVTVDFTEVNIEMEPESEMKEWFGNIADTLDEEKKGLEPIESTLTSAKFSSEENIENTDNSESEKQIEQPLNKATSEINLPSRKLNVESAPSGGGLNNLIRRMTGFGEKREQKDNEATQDQIVRQDEKLITDREDESKLEIPAFLRRQAN